MNTQASDNYLLNEVMTATPEKLHLMLIDAAIRQAQRAKMHWQAQEEKEADKCILHAQRIVIGIIGGIDFNNTKLVSNVSQVYLFICQALTHAFTDNDKAKLDDALRVLEIERETWRQLCNKLAKSPASHTPDRADGRPGAPNISFGNASIPDLPAGSFSLEA